VWPPELHLQPALFLPDLARARALGALFAAGAAPWVATAAQSARANAGALAAAGIVQVALAGTPADAAAGAVLGHELRRLGIAVGESSALVATAPLDAGGAVPFAIAAAGAAVPPWVFTAAGDAVLQRAAAVPTQGLPEGLHWGLHGGVRALRLHRGPPKGGDDDDVADNEGTLHVLVLDEALPVAVVADAAASLAARFGPARLRLHVEAPASRFGTRALAALAVPALRERVLAANMAAQPRLAPLLATACHWCDLGVDPLLQCWAGNGIAERNADLTVNLVP
jgi:hypothetical protein